MSIFCQSSPLIPASRSPSKDRAASARSERESPSRKGIIQSYFIRYYMLSNIVTYFLILMTLTPSHTSPRPHCQASNCQYCPLLDTSCTIRGFSDKKKHRTRIKVSCLSDNLIYAIECTRCHQHCGPNHAHSQCPDVQPLPGHPHL